ncbi:VOC family protein [Bacillus massilinigeriensis]|uniref:VOC family protein n=1 Tax=Bacillus massilionigeriensis TaxID=1805475 RepID=UPI00096B3647|nr:VOC family protein [Bacillus massilionigeriensis]
MTSKFQKITANLWFNDEAEDAARFYTSIFKNSKINRIIRYRTEKPDSNGNSEGAVMTVAFQLEGNEFVALNGGPNYPFTEAISFIVNCENQEEIDYYWEKLSEGGDKKAQVCGWLKDKFGVSWQIVPAVLNDMLSNANSKKSDRVMKTLLQMKTKINIEELNRAFEDI